MNWSGLAPELVWGLIPRLMGVLYIIAFGALAPQLVGIIGSRGASSIASRLNHARRDFPGLRRFQEWPTIFWLDASDRFIALVPWIGLCAGALAVYGGPLGWVGLLVGWFLWLSVEPAGLIFPWDTMLQEAGFLVLWLPLTNTLPELTTSALPLPAVAFMHRWLVIRLMLGFAKVKFIGTGKGDSLYLRGFLIWAPLPTPISWWGHHLPQWALRFSLGFMFVGEAIAPWLCFFTGLPRLIGCGILTALMLGIHITGNWGYFNLGYIALCVSLLDLDASLFDAWDAPWAGHNWQGQNAVINGAMAILFFNSLVYFLVMNSWVSRTWVHWLWETVTWNRWWARWLISWHRFWAPFHLTNGYGVFPPASQPPMRLAPVIEGSMDGVTWKQYGYRFLPTRPTQKLPIVAPHHPRFDQALHYCAIGMHDGSFFNSLIGDGTPYLAYLRTCWLERAAQRLLTSDPFILRELGHDPFDGRAPKQVRVSAYALAPTRIDEYRRSGERWRVRRIGLMIPARGPQPWVDEQAVPEPELFHPDMVRFKKRAYPLQEIVRQHAAGKDIDEAVLAVSDLTRADVETFWKDFVPALNVERANFAKLHERAAALQARFEPLTMYRMERLLQRYTWILRMRSEDHFIKRVEPKIDLVSNWRYEMLLHEIVADGRDAYLQYVAQPSLCAERARSTTDESQLWVLAMVRYDMMIFHARTFRWNIIGAHGHHYKLHGIFEYFPILVNLIPPDEEWRPQPIKHDDGEFTIPGIYAAPEEPSLSEPASAG